MTARRIAIVPHTHWDREWYKSYQDFRLALVELIDTLLPLLERDASYPHFMLDGQMAVVDDYLEVRPEAESRLRALAAAGRLSMGPWYILMDEFLASGETIVRNLQMGLGRGAAFGGVMELGYLPDMFGHIAQMPQILRLAGFHDAVVWRGVPSQVTKNAFTWASPDGSEVRTEYLPVGYGNGAALPDDAKALIRRTDDNVAEIADFLMGDLLCMNGSDHLMPQPWLGRVVAEANELQDDFAFEVTSFPHYLANAPTGRADAGRRRAALGGPRQHAHGRHVEPRRRQAARGARRAGIGTTRRAIGRAVPGARGLPGPLPGAGLARNGPQLGPRLHLRLLRRRRRRRRPAPLRRGRGNRRGAGGPRRQDLRPLAVARRPDGAQPLVTGPRGAGGAGRARRRPGPGDRAGAVRAGQHARIDGARRGHCPHGAGDDARTEDQ